MKPKIILYPGTLQSNGGINSSMTKLFPKSMKKSKVTLTGTAPDSTVESKVALWGPL